MFTESSTNYPILLACLLFMSILLAMFIFSLLRQYRFRLIEYEWQLAREIELIDAERKRIHIDLHDEIGAGLSSIGIILQQYPVQNGEIQRKIVDQVQSMRTVIREIAYDFVPPSLDTIGLNKTIIHLFDEIEFTHQIKTITTLDFDDSEFKPQKAVHMYRIVKEITTNTLKHACCNSIHCSIITKQKTLHLLITDDGIGFNTTYKHSLQKGAGLSHIYSRAKLLNARVNLVTSVGNGVKYEIRIPLKSLQTDNAYE